VLGIDAFDPGVGINAVSAKSPNKVGWGHSAREDRQNECVGKGGYTEHAKGVQCNECYENECAATKAHSKPLSLPFTELGELPEGEDTVGIMVQDAMGLSATATGKIKVDNSPPHNLVLTGLPAGGKIGEGEYKLVAEATDGSGSTPSSGVRSLAIAVDGVEVGKPSGSCSTGPCTARGEWTISGGEYGAGGHKLTLTATDNAGNVSTETYTLKVNHASPVSLGPGSVNPQSGEFSMSATDVLVGSPGAGLTVSRNYGSRHLTAGSGGPLGPQWSLSVGGQESIVKLPNGNVTLVAADGGQSTFTPSGGGKFVSPTGDGDLVLTEITNEKGEPIEYALKVLANATTTRFTSFEGPAASVWKPTKEEGPLASQTVRYIYRTVEGVTEPKYILAPEPNGLSFSCASKLEKMETLEKGCRALEFIYGEETAAKGEDRGEWGNYRTRLKEIVFIAYNLSTKRWQRLKLHGMNTIAKVDCGQSGTHRSLLP
jgi:hypothetical protein